MRLQQFEQRLERLVEGAFAKAFRGELQPIELGRRLTREMDLHRTVAARGLIAPNFFEVVLSERDAERFQGFVEVLARELVEAAREHARNERYSFLGPVEVEIGWSEELEKSTFAINVAVRESEDQGAGHLVMPNGEHVPLAAEVLTIGRLPECDITLDDANVSRRHAQLRRDGELVYLIDLGSTNGTLVNGVAIRQHLLSPGDLVTIGKTPLRFELD
jgi:hypothetical protein